MPGPIPSSVDPDSDDELANIDVTKINAEDWQRRMKERAERGDLREDFEESDSDEERYLDVDFPKFETSTLLDLTAAEKLEIAQQRKAEGTNAFTAGDWATARGHFLAALAPLKYEFDFFESDADSSTYVQLHASCLLNAAQCELKLSQWSGAITLCTRALDTRLEHVAPPVVLQVKALFRRGTARLKMSDFTLARADLKMACQLNPKSAEIRAAYESVSQAEKAAKQAEAACFAGKLDKLDLRVGQDPACLPCS